MLHVPLLWRPAAPQPSHLLLHCYGPRLLLLLLLLLLRVQVQVRGVGRGGAGAGRPSGLCRHWSSCCCWCAPC
jgi:hypothetical protein